MIRGRHRDRRHDAVHASSAGGAHPGDAGGGAGAAAKARRSGSEQSEGAKPAVGWPRSAWLPPLRRSEWLALGVLEGGVLVVYSSTLYPSVAGGDSGELVAESCHLGVSHPPGYPLFNMLVHTWMKLTALAFPGDAASSAWRANLFSAGASCDVLGGEHGLTPNGVIGGVQYVIRSLPG